MRKLVLRAAKYLILDENVLEISVSGLEMYADRLVDKVFYNLIDNSFGTAGR